MIAVAETKLRRDMKIKYGDGDELVVFPLL